ncbi:hypothetical protein JCM3775_006699 [Rhodotorula graminis]|uniref:DUF427 domain-containing protein n=1 Tax=Rhodotorula graminis (strain WP1) TaxID=578459 RepID=A0A194S9I5_RHOGW|nr:uncharacterized protein RHOBADRAFT_12157 [Rhodotorula graminis WP1]KPV77125.1 hypothetical protein RHOBADRAFT_12157 [Rhodotorula graminis WP1]
MVKATLNGTVLAESANTQVVEGNHYFPPDSVKKEFFTDSNTHTTCGWKGVASYYNANVDGKEVKDAAWYYPATTTDKAKPIENYVAFYGSKVQVK